MFKFVAWWWRKQDGITRIATSMILWFAISLMTIPVASIGSIAMLLSGFVAILLFTFAYQLYLGIYSEVRKYKREKEQEETRIIARLRGDY